MTSCTRVEKPEGPVESADAGLVASAHRDGDDLLSAGLGLAGLRAAIPPPFADPAAPTPAELRRRAIWTNWRGIADLTPGGGFGEFYGRMPAVPGREYHALLRLPGASQPHRAMVQVPDEFDVGARCLVVTASSGSRGIYGAIALAGGWGLPRGCAVVYTDKGAGTGWFDTASGQGSGLDGTLGGAADGLEFTPAGTGAESSPRVLIKHAHSGDNPEVDWGRHVRQAAEFGLRVLNESQAQGKPYTFENTRVIALGVSNGGGAVLRAAEIEGDWLDGVVAISPNILPGQGGRPLYDYATEAALYLPCALTDAAFDREPNARSGGSVPAVWRARCAGLREAGLLNAASPAAQAAEALALLRRNGWTEGALHAAAVSTVLDLWRAVAVGYSAAYLRRGAESMPCGYRYAMLDAEGRPRAAATTERAAWWSDTAGIPPAGGVGIVDGMAYGLDPALAGLRCLRELWSAGDAPDGPALHAGVEATRASLPPPDLPMIVIHGAEDGLVLERFSGGAYVDWLRGSARAPVYWRVSPAQHFDAFLALPPLAARYLPLLPYGYRAMDALWAHLAEGTALPASAEIRGRPRQSLASGLEPLTVEHLDW